MLRCDVLPCVCVILLLCSALGVMAGCGRGGSPGERAQHTHSTHFLTQHTLSLQTPLPLLTPRHCAPTMQMSLHFPEHTVSFLTTVPLHVCALWTRIWFLFETNTHPSFKSQLRDHLLYKTLFNCPLAIVAIHLLFMVHFVHHPMSTYTIVIYFCTRFQDS